MKNDLLYLEHILTSINKINQYSNSGKDAFMNSPIFYAVVPTVFLGTPDK